MPKKAEAAKSNAKQDSDNRTMMLVAYIFTWLSGLIVLLTAGKEDPEVRFHAWQAILLGVAAIAMFVMSFLVIPFFIGWAIVLYGWYIGYMAYSKGERIVAPVVGEYAIKQAEKD